MPFIQVTMIEGRTVEQKHALIRQITQACISTLDAQPDNVRIAIYEVSADEWGVAGEAVSVMRARTAKS